MTATTEQCTCGHARDRHSPDCHEDCPCTGYESWITPQMALANSRRIAGDNADLFAIANKTIEEVRALVAEWRIRTKNTIPAEIAAKISMIDNVESELGLMNYQADFMASELEAIVQRFDAAIKEQIK